MSKLTSLLIVVFLGVCLLGCNGHTKESLNEEGERLSRQGNYNGAIVHYKNALEKDPNYLAARFNLALAYLETGKLDQAERELRKVLLQDPYDLRVSLHLGRIANFQDKPDVAIPLLKAYLERHPTDATALEQLAVAASIQGDVQAVRSYLEQALAAEPGRISAQIALARHYMAQDDRAKARELLESLLKAHPKDRAGLHALAQLEFRERDPEGMLDIYSRISALYPTDLFARYKEGSLRLDKGEMDQAKASAEAMLKEYPDKAEGYRLMGRLLFQDGKYEEAATHLQKSIRIQPDVEAYFLLGQAFFNLGNLEMAVTQFQTILDANPRFAPARLFIGDIFLRQGRGAEALDVAEKMLEANPSDFRGFTLQSDALLLQGKAREALAALDNAAKLAPSHYGVLLKRGMLRLSLGDAAGEQDLTDALKISPKSLDARMALHSLYLRTRRSEEAEAVLRQGLGSGKTDAVLYNALAKMSFGRRDMDSAWRYLDQARAADPNLLHTYYNGAAMMLSQGKPDEAVAQYDLALAARPLDVRSLIGSAVILDGQGKTDAARERLEKARGTGDPGAVLMLSRFLQRHGQGDDAVAVLEDAVRRHPETLAFVQAKAALHLARKEMDKAMTLYDQLEAADPRMGILERIKAWMTVGDMGKAEAEARRLIELNPENGDAYGPLATLLEVREDRGAAEELLRRGLTSDPDNARLGVLLGEFYMRGGERDRALDAYESVLRRAPTNVAALTGKGVVLQIMGRREEAVRAYVQAVQSQANYAPALNNLAMLWADDEKTRQNALSLAMAAFTASSGDPAVVDTLGYALVRNGRFEEALRILDRANELAGGNGSILYHRALALDGLDRRQDAIAALEAALEVGNFGERTEAEAMLRSLRGAQ